MAAIEAFQKGLKAISNTQMMTVYEDPYTRTSKNCL